MSTAAGFTISEIDVPVVATVELENAVAPLDARAIRHRGGHGLGATDHESHQLRVGIRRRTRSASSPSRDARSRTRIGGSALHRLDDRADA
jgi:hypothetical protein